MRSLPCTTAPIRAGSAELLLCTLQDAGGRDPPTCQNEAGVRAKRAECSSLSVMPLPGRDKLADRGPASLGHYNATRRRLVHAVAGVPHRGMSSPSCELESVGTRQLDLCVPKTLVHVMRPGDIR